MATKTIDEKHDEVKYRPVPPARVQQAVMRAYVTLRGLKPLLMSSDKEMHLQEIESPIKLIKVRGSKINPKTEAEKRAYRTLAHGWEGELCVPAKCIKRNLLEAVKVAEFQTENNKKLRSGFSMIQKVKGSVDIEPEFIPLIHTDGSPVTDYEVDSSKVRISATKGSVIRYRPVIRDWALRFVVKWNPHLYAVREGIIEHLFDKGGNIGLLDNRPEFGIYDMVEFSLDESSIKLARELDNERRQPSDNGNGKKGKK